MIHKPYNQVGKAGIEANIEYYLRTEQRLRQEAQKAREEREQWERALERLDRNNSEHAE